jgi:hypothetical protein
MAKSVQLLATVWAPRVLFSVVAGKFLIAISGTALGYGLDDRGFDSLQGLGIFSSLQRPERF